MAERQPHQTASNLAATLAPLLDGGQVTPRLAFDRLASLGFRFVQLSATQPGMRPRDLDKTARRDLLAILRRAEMAPSGIDAWIPSSHFTNPSRSDRAVAAVLSAIDLAADLERVPLSVILPDDQAIRCTIAAHADHRGIGLADHNVPPRTDEGVGVGIDPAAWLAQGANPAHGVLAHGPRLLCARLCDLLTTGMRGPIGDSTGRLDVTEYQIALSVSGYGKPVIVDARQWQDVWAGLQQTQQHWAGTAFTRS